MKSFCLQYNYVETKASNFIKLKEKKDIIFKSMLGKRALDRTEIRSKSSKKAAIDLESAFIKALGMVKKAAALANMK